jgi:hypothetical protein
LTTSLAAKIKSQKIKTSGYGLYSLNNEYVFRGEVVNNYILIGKDLWRILKITENNEIVILKSYDMGYAVPWDDRYNATTKYNSGVNEFKISRLYEFLDGLLEVPDDEYGLNIPREDFSKFTTFNACIGKRSLEEKSKDNSVECAEILNNQRVTLLTVSDYMIASVDQNCNITTSESCQNYNYLSDYNRNQWLLTASTTNNSTAFGISREGIIKEETTYAYLVMRPVMRLDSGVMYKSGKGTEEKPYIIR